MFCLSVCFPVVDGASGLQLLLSSTQRDTHVDLYNEHHLLIYSSFSTIHRPNSLAMLVAFLASMPRCPNIQDCWVLTLCSIPDLLTTVLHTAFPVSTPTRLAFPINQPLLIPIAANKHLNFTTLCHVLFMDEASVEFTVYSSKIESTVWQAGTAGITMSTGKLEPLV